MTRFLEWSVPLREPVQENAEIVTAFLSDYAFDVFEQDQNILKAYGLIKDFSASTLEEIHEIIQAFSSAHPELRYIPKQNWNELWESHYFEPITIDNRVRVRAVFQESDPTIPLELLIQPKMSFGTGHHSTTQLMISLMLDHELQFSGAQVLDMGAGTGILAIVAEKLGALQIEAVDIEDWAAQNIDENTVLNACEHIVSHHGDAAFLSKFQNPFDIVLANIHKQVLLQDGATYAAKIKPAGWIYLSGFYQEDVQDIQNHYESLGFGYVEMRSTNNWCAMLLQKQA